MGVTWQAARRWAATQAGRSPERADVSPTCRQCGRDGVTTVVRLGPRRARYWCARCGAVVSTSDLAAVRRHHEPGPPVPPEPPTTAEDPLLDVMPAEMVAWLRRTTARPPTRDALDKSAMYQAYARWDRASGSTLPTFPAAVGALHERCYATEAALAALRGPHEAAGEAAGEAAVRERVEHARRWLATEGRSSCWLVSRLVDGHTVDPAPEDVRRLLPEVGTAREWSRDETWAVRAALFGTDGGPHVRHVLSVFPADEVRDALAAWLRDGSRPLRSKALAALDAPRSPA